MLETWKQFVEGEVVGVLPERPILESWERCRSFDVATARAQLRRVPLPELNERLARAASLVEAAKKHLVWALAALEGFEPVIIILTDEDGVVLHSIGNAPEAMVQFGLIPGFDWSERAMGTNGIGTAIAFGAPVAVVGAEHYIQTWHNNTCVGAPVRGPDGRIRGAVDISTSAKDGDPARLVLVAFLAHVIGLELGAVPTTSYATDDVLDRASVLGSSGRRPDLVATAHALARLEPDLLGTSASRGARETALAPLLEGVAERAGAKFAGLPPDAPERLHLNAPDLLDRALTHLAALLHRRGAGVTVLAANEASRVAVRIEAEPTAPADNLERAGVALGEWLAEQLLTAAGATLERDAAGRTGYTIRLPA